MGIAQGLFFSLEVLIQKLEDFVNLPADQRL